MSCMLLPVDKQIAWGHEMFAMATELFPLHRSITGDGLRTTLAHIGRYLPIEQQETPSGTSVFDWTVPAEWQIHDASISDNRGYRVVDYQASNLHVVAYSQPVEATLSGEALTPYLHYLDEYPEWIPYRTAYFNERWGFCVTAQQYRTLRDGGPWHVRIDSRFVDGGLTTAECLLPGKSEETVMFHCHTCHPSLANDNLSGIVVATALARILAQQQLHYTYLFTFTPATIGAITWLAGQSSERLAKIRAGLVLSNLGDKAAFTYKQSKQYVSLTDRAMQLALEQFGQPHSVRPFEPFGYDERQFSSPGINLPVGRLSRSVHGEFAEYHTSADNLKFISSQALGESLSLCLAFVDQLENTPRPRSNAPLAEPNLGRRGLYRAFAEVDDRGKLQAAMMWILNQADGSCDLAQIAQRAGLSLCEVERAAEVLRDHDLIDY